MQSIARFGLASPAGGRLPLVPLAALWTTLWALVSIIESAGYIHDPNVPRWQPWCLILTSVVPIIVWLALEIRSDRYFEIPVDPPSAWFLHHLLRLPLLASGYIAVVFGPRHVLFQGMHALYFHLPWPALISFEFVKFSLFYGLWLGVVYGALSMLRAREQSAQLALARSALTQAQLAQLQAQLRPHFLFNTLNTISALMHTDVRRADRVLTQLGDLLRASLGASAASTVPLMEELELLRLYAGIMQERFSGRLELAWEVDADALPVPVPVMLLQPLLENAFKYGIEQAVGHQRIRVIAARIGGVLQIKIHNTGSSLQVGWRDGVGIANCRERLRVLYGESARLTINNDTAGVMASIDLPLQRVDA